MPIYYYIRLKGHLDRHWSAWFDNMTISNEANSEAVLHGPLVDQAALHGVLIKIRDLGLPLLAVTTAAMDESLNNTLILGVLLAGWHAPLALAEGSIAAPYLIATIASAVVTNWVYYNARESALLAIVYHTAANTMGQYFFPTFAGPDLVRAYWLLAAVNCVVAVIVVLATGPYLRHQLTAQVEPAPVGQALT